MRPGTKGRNFVREEEEQLCRSVLHVSQDRITGNQQRAGVFWERIHEHYNLHKPFGERPSRSLETKWGHIKHDVSKFIGIYSQVVKLNKSGTSAADTLRKAHDLYKSKHVKGCNFYFEHCWNLLKEHPKWADGWSQVKPPTAKRKALSTDQDSDCVEVGASSGLEGAASMEQSVSTGRPGGTKAAKADQKAGKVREAAIYAQAEATKTMALQSASIRNAAVIF